MVAAYGVGSALASGGYSLSSLPKASVLCLPVLLVHSVPSLPMIYCLWLFLVVYLLTRTQQSGLSTKRPGPVSLSVGAVVSPQAAAAQRGVVCLSTKAAAVWGMTQYRDPGGYSLSSLPKASIPHFSSGICSPPCSNLYQSLR